MIQQTETVLEKAGMWNPFEREGIQFHLTFSYHFFLLISE